MNPQAASLADMKCHPSSVPTVKKKVQLMVSEPQVKKGRRKRKTTLKPASPLCEDDLPPLDSPGAHEEEEVVGKNRRRRSNKKPVTTDWDSASGSEDSISDQEVVVEDATTTESRQFVSAKGQFRPSNWFVEKSVTELRED